jgi:glycosyltransferase involved in cell wall biosynthesis
MNLERVLISICIPAYKRPENLRRLLRSVSSQVFQNYEIVISDDSPDDSVSKVVNEFKNLPIKYYLNKRPLGTPANWNFAISKAVGKWIKLMHDDDWFYDEQSLQNFAHAANETQSKFIFSEYFDVFENGGRKKSTFPPTWKNRILNNPVTLLSENVIGPPSVTLIHESIKEQYDERMKWRVDIDFYIRLLLAQKDYRFIPQPLINVGIGSTQVTNSCLNNPVVELPEGWLLLVKYGPARLKNVRVYDAWWRIIRNVKVRSAGQLGEYAPGKKWPEAIIKMISHQSIIPYWLLKVGPFSKLLMVISYALNRKY